MNWRNNPPLRYRYETQEEYEDALNNYVDALEADYEDRKNRESD